MNGVKLDTALAELARALDRTSAASAVVAANLVNLDTPDYVSQQIVFEDVLGGSLPMARTDSEHLPLIAPQDPGGQVRPAPVTRVRGDGNTVDVDREMTLLGALRGRYTASAEMVRKRFALLVYAATDGRSSG